MAALLPIFPLESVLLPGLPLPLHIFEPRYRALVADVSAEGIERCFGVVALQHGFEVESGPEPDGQPLSLAAIGTVAEIVEIESYDDGRSDLLTIGSRRFRILGIDRGRSYLRAEVEWLEESDGDVRPGLTGAARELCGLYVRALARLARREANDDPLATDPLRLSYQVAAQLRLPNSERQELLEAATAADRLAHGMHLLRREIALITQTRSIPVSPRALQVDASSN